VKENWITCVLADALAFEILSYALRETMVPLSERVLKIVFWYNSQYHIHIPLDVRQVSKSVSVQGIF
jgi:hypothetical protein